MSDDTKLREEMTEKYWDEQILRGELYAREQEVAELRADLELAVAALSECEGHFLSIELDYGAELGNTPKMIASNGLASIRETLTKLGAKK